MKENKNNRRQLDDSFYDEWDDEVPQASWKKRTFQIMVALLFIGATIYLYGIYQLTFLTRTNAPDEPAQYESILEREEVTLPLHITVFEQSERVGSYRDEENIVRLVENASAIWNQADITLELADIDRVVINEDDEQRFIGDPQGFIESHLSPPASQIHVVLLRTLQGINGVAFGGSQAVAVADYTSFSDYRTLAHEIGHVFGLSHTSDAGRLMISGGRGTNLTQTEAEQAYNRARTLGK